MWCGELYSEGLAFVKFTTGARGMCVGAEIGCATDGKKVQMYRHHQNRLPELAQENLECGEVADARYIVRLLRHSQAPGRTYSSREERA